MLAIVCASNAAAYSHLQGRTDTRLYEMLETREMRREDVFEDHCVGDDGNYMDQNESVRKLWDRSCTFSAYKCLQMVRAGNATGISADVFKIQDGDNDNNDDGR